MSIGHIDTESVLEEARKWAFGTGADEAPSLQSLDDLTPWAHARVRFAARTLAASKGGLVVSSGGTTGTPKLTVISPDMGLPRILPHWSPLGEGDVLLNMFSTGRMWGAQYFYNALALHSRSTVAPIGGLTPEDAEEWADTIVDMGVNALCGTPNLLARFGTALHTAGIRLPVRTVIWTGEPMTPARHTAITQVFPQAGLWGNYGSIETFVIGVSNPLCEPGTLHLLPGQLLETDHDGALLTRVGEGWPVPAVRFRLGDRIGPAACACGSPDGFTVLGRADDSFKLYGSMLRASDVLRQAAQVEDIGEAQVVLHHEQGAPAAALLMELRFTGPADEEAVRAEMASRIDGMGILDRHTPEALRFLRVEDVERSPSSDKVLPLVRREAGLPLMREGVNT
ncbi:AMP-binding protein [Nocardiopsis sp. M1B1]|uniref:AMP-binding protein n=1 Tax=Nocardiopsis sp. M1B1 TaxID=3450454 RepID=UPI0040395991